MGMRKLLLLPLVLIVGAIIGGVVVARDGTNPSHPSESIVCAPDDYPCLERQYDARVKAGYAERVVASLPATATSAGCHEAAHIAGRVVGRIEPDTAIELNTAELDAQCDYGYLHGVFQGLASIGRDPVAAAKSHCSQRDGVVEQDECFHAAGHGAAITNETMKAALDACTVLEGAAAESCASGVYMEHVSSYLGNRSRAEGYGPEAIGSLEAGTMCSDVSELLLYPCVRKAALFWGPTIGADSLRDRCRAIVDMASNQSKATWACGAGVGEWLRNYERWGIPETAEEAAVLNGTIVSACAAALGSKDDTLLAACIEGVVTAILPGQVAGGVDPTAWIDPCPVLVAADLVEAGRECGDLRTELVGTVS